MDLGNLRINQLTADGWRWYQDYLTVLDAYVTMGYALVHEPLNIYGDDDHFVLEALNHYDSGDGARITVRATAWTDRDDDGKVTSVRLYQDLSPLYGRTGR